jgi:hypothetical protein
MQGAHGKTSNATMIERLSQPTGASDRRELARVFFRRMWQLGHLFYRTA